MNVFQVFVQVTKIIKLSISVSEKNHKCNTCLDYNIIKNILFTGQLVYDKRSLLNYIII